MIRIAALPLIVILLGVAALMMWVPVFHAVTVRDWLAGRSFFYSGVFFLVISSFVAIATAGQSPRSLARSHLAALATAFTLLPAALAMPVWLSMPGSSFGDAWFEMVSSLTTTGATLYDFNAIPNTVHLWRALVGWMGGFLIWVAAVAVLAPMNLGGFEVLSTAQAGTGVRTGRTGGAGPTKVRGDRVLRHAARLAPIYGGLTLSLWLGLVILGEAPFVAACHAMSVLATSGISPVGGMSGAQAGLQGEALIFAFFLFALTRTTFSRETMSLSGNRLLNDPELRIALFLLALVPSFLFLRHWLGAYEAELVSDFGAAVRALWGAAFSVMSFISTTGFVSTEWESARAWSGLATPGLLLLGLALIGGGVATTAGGVKLLRVYALYKHGQRELERLVHPSSVSGGGPQARRLRQQGAYISWIFFMLFALSLTLAAILVAAAGVEFDAALVLTVASLANTGPVAAVVLEVPIAYADLSTLAKTVLAAAMVLGRLETLAIIALFNPEFWRK